MMFFHQGVSANPMSRLITVFGVVEEGHLHGDAWGAETIDKAIVHGHVYSDKAPLSSFLVIPLYAAWRHAHRNAPQAVYETAAVHIADVVVAALPFAIFAVLLRRRAAVYASAGVASRIALVSSFSTCLFNYGNIYFSHMLSALLWVTAYVLAVDRGRCALAGFVGGCGVLAEYPIALLDFILACWLLGRRGSTWRRSAAFVMGATPPAIAMLGYNFAVTGRPFDFPYSHVTDTWQAMRVAFGVRLPSIEAEWELLFGQYRGLLFYAPTLALFVPLALRKPSPGDFAPGDDLARARHRWLLLLALCSAQYLFVCSYFKWDGGWCTGPRHLAPVIALLVYEGAGKLARGWPRWRLAFYATGLMGIAINLAAAATNPVPSESQIHPLVQVFLPDLYAGHVNGHNLVAEAGLRSGTGIVGVWFLLFGAVLGILAIVDRSPSARLRARAPADHRG
ncbi:MAG TPA: hypothetical protein VEK07_20655 [Polyangiaceae bacterium]|nr:hypothetical protein [Polyangiaceae bacterium]